MPRPKPRVCGAVMSSSARMSSDNAEQSALLLHTEEYQLSCTPETIFFLLLNPLKHLLIIVTPGTNPVHPLTFVIAPHI